MRLTSIRQSRLPRFSGIAALASLVLTGCATPDVAMQRMAQDEAPIVMGSAPRKNGTPLDPAFACLFMQIVSKQKPAVSIAVGDIKDYTGKYSQSDGNALTQGGALMVYSALGKLGSAVELRERFDTRIAELELAYTDRRQLGDGQAHMVSADKEAKKVPWLPYFGGSILKSNYYIVGGITELNYNIQSGGVDLQVGGVGPKARSFTMGVGVDLRIVDTETLRVVSTISLQKQITGHEVGFNVFRFFGSDLFDMNAGYKNLEPLQLGVRTTLEQGVLELVSRVTQTDAGSCIAETALAAREPAQAKADAQAAAPVPADNKPAQVQSATSLNDPANPASAGNVNVFDMIYEAESTQIARGSASNLDALAASVRAGASAKVAVVSRDGEATAPDKRRQLTEVRIQNLRNQLAQRGINPDRVRLTWQPADGDQSLYRHSPGFQVQALLQVVP